MWPLVASPGTKIVRMAIKMHWYLHKFCRGGLPEPQEPLEPLDPALQTVATNIEPLEVRRKGAMLKYWARTIYNPQNPTRKAFRDPITQASNSHIENTPYSSHSATWTTHELAKKQEINEKDIRKRSILRGY
ncbi:hypothetical protein PoB_003340600 [Plakobranchus ocellatus]|uniref:Uncharacterized protein n=1 Tax=Plakobranchus ocellatus TaxID=259542 RepID=A0AAV4AJX2_9GAST|nr:hypothetical protein PoB_003340600 [Plakobranchus ocellatus]